MKTNYGKLTNDMEKVNDLKETYRKWMNIEKRGWNGIKGLKKIVEDEWVWKRMNEYERGLMSMKEDEWVWKRMKEYERGWMSMKKDGKDYRGL